MKQRKTVTPDQVKAARERSGLTQEAAAALIGYTRRAWQDWEAGSRGMRSALFEMFVQRAKGQS